MTLMLRFSGNASGDLTFAGNALGLSSIAELLLPPKSNVLYAELVWAGWYINLDSNLHDSIDNPIHLTTPEGTKFRILPDPTTASFIGEYEYVRSANVTDIIQSGGAGTYIVNGTTSNMRNSDTFSSKLVGWTLCVIYENAALPLRNVSLNVGGVRVNPSSSVSTTISGFGTPLSGPVTGKLAVCIGEQDEDISNQQVLNGFTAVHPINHTDPNDVFNHLFNSLVEKNSSASNESTPFAMPYSMKNEIGRNVTGNRRWDISNVDISQSLFNNQTSAMFQFRTTGDLYNLYAAGISIDINQPELDVHMRVDTTEELEEQTLTYIVVVQNTGVISVDSVIIFDSLADHTLFISESVCINEEPSPPDSNPTVGVLIGTINPKQSITVTYKVKIAARLLNSTVSNKAIAKFQYRTVAEGSILDGHISSNEVVFALHTPQNKPAKKKADNFPLKVKQKASSKSITAGENICFTIIITNASKVPVENVVLTNLFEDGTKFIAKSVKINGKSNSRAKPTNGIPLLTLDAGQSIEVSYSAKQLVLPSTYKIRNHATVSFRPIDSTETQTVRSNVVVIKAQVLT